MKINFKLPAVNFPLRKYTYLKQQKPSKQKAQPHQKKATAVRPQHFLTFRYFDSKHRKLFQ